VNRALIACAATLWTAAACGCTSNIGIDDFKYACQKDTECGEGQACQDNWCVKIPGRQDGGTADAADTGVHKDAGHDGGEDAGRRDVGLIIQYSSTSDTTAGLGSSDKYILKSATGWSSGPMWNVESYQLRIGNPFTQGGK